MKNQLSLPVESVSPLKAKSLFRRIYQTAFSKKINRLAYYWLVVLFLIGGVGKGWGQLYWGGTAAQSWTATSGTRWGTVEPTYNTTWVSGSAAVFNVASSTITGATTNFASITSNENVTVTPTGTLGTGGTVATITIASSKTFDFGSQAISTAAGTGFIKSGLGVLAMAGSAYTGGFTLNAGTIVVRGINVFGNGALNLNGGTVAANANRTIAAAGLTITVGGNVQFGADNVLGTSGNVSNISFPSTCGIALGSSARTFTLGNGGIHTFNGIISNTPTNSLTFDAITTGTGRFDVANTANTFTGAVNINGDGGTGVAEVRFTADGSLGNSSNSVTIDGGRLSIVSAGTVTITAARNIFVGNTAGTSISVPGAGTLTYDGVIANKPSTTGSWLKQGTGVLKLGGVSTYSGSTTINLGTLQLTTGNDRLPTGTTLGLGEASAVNLGTFDLNSRNQQVAGLNSLTGTNTTSNNNTLTSSGAATLTIGGGGTYSYGNNTTNNTNSGVISGAISLVKSGGGTQTLGDTCTYTGTTTINGGALIVNGSLAAASAVTVGASGTLAGSGKVNGSVSLSGTISPGNSPGTISTGAFTFNAGSKYKFEITNVAGTPGTNWDYLVSSGAIDVSTATITIDLTAASLPSFVNTAIYNWKFATGSSITGFSASNFSVSTTNFAPSFTGTFSVTKTGNDLFLSYCPLTNTSSITGFISVCAGTNGVSYSVLNTVGSTYAWTITSGTQASGTNTNAITVDWGAAGAGNVSVVETNSCGTTGSAVNLPVTINPLLTFYRDLDGDGLGDPAVTIQACNAPAGYVADNTDFCPLTLSSVSNSGNCGCAPGFYPVYTVIEGQNVITGCSSCPAGSYCPDGLVAPIPCPAGKYSDVTGSEICMACEAGKFNPLTGQTSCQPCPAGQYSDVTGSTSCIACEAGKFNPLTGQTSCQPCPAGQYSDVTGSTSCIACEAGKFNPIPGQTSCQPCPAGQYSDVIGSTSCIACEAGKFNPIPGQTSCQPCPAGQYSDVTGSTSCIACEAGKFNPIPGQTSCQPCPAGQYSDVTGSTSCIACEAGKFNPIPGQTSCQPCPAGQYNPSLGQTTCVPCEAGKFSSTVGQIACTPCPAGQYNPSLGQTQCVPCEAGKYIGVTGAIACIPCPAGEYNPSTGQTICTPCEAGSYNDQVGQIECTPCPAGQFSDVTGSTECMDCPNGTYNNLPGQTECLDCPPVTCPANSSMCSNDVTITLTASPPGGTYSGSTGIVGNTFDPSLASIGANVITYNYTDGNGCAGECSFTITVNQAPAVNLNPDDQHICQANTTMFTGTFTGSLPMTFEWQMYDPGVMDWVPVPNMAPFSGETTNTLTVTNPTLEYQNRQFRLKSSNSCGSATTDPATLTLDQFFEAMAGDDDATCSLNYNLLGNDQGFATGTWTMTGGTGTATFDDASMALTTVHMSGAGAYGAKEFTWMIVNGLCSSSDAVLITFNEPPAAPPTPTSNSPQCFPASVTITATGSAPAGETWYWETSPTGTSTSFPATTPYNASSSGTIHIRSQHDTSLCWGEKTSISVVVKGLSDPPVVNAPICPGINISITGTSSEANNTNITVYRNGTSVGNTIVIGGVWTKSGLTLVGGDLVKATATASDECESLFSNIVTVQNNSDAPVVNAPICPGINISITGTSSEANNTNITVYRNGTSVGNTIVIGGVWTKSGLTLVGGDLVKATATASGECESPFSNIVTVQNNSDAPVVNSPLCPGASVTVTGTSTEADGTQIEVFVNAVSVGYTPVTSALWSKSGLTLVTGNVITAKATATGECESLSSNPGQVIDVQAPTLTCFTNQILTAANCTANYTIADPVDDDCTNATWDYVLSGATTANVSGIPDGTGSGPIAFNIGITNVTLSATDGTNNATPCVRTITVNAPEINVQGNANSILDGDNTPSATDHTDFGNVNVGNNLVRTYTIQNTGTSNLAVSSVSVAGGNAAMFTVGSLTPASPIPAGNSATVTVTFTPITIGLKTTTVHVANTDCDESDYDFAIQGNGTCATSCQNGGTQNADCSCNCPPGYGGPNCEYILPTLGAYPNATVMAGKNTIVTPGAAPTNTLSAVAYAALFKGVLSVNPATGVVTVTDALQAGVFSVTVKAFGAGGTSSTTTFTLTVTNPVCSQGLFTTATPVGVGASPHGVAVGDFNGDGIQDLAVTNYDNSNVSIKLGNGSGGFSGSTTVPVGGSPLGIAVGDFNGDGKQDIVVTNTGPSKVAIRLGDGSGGFTGTTQVTVGVLPSSVAIGDFNGDGKQDIVVANTQDYTASIRLGDGNGGFTGTLDVPNGSRVYSVAISEFNSDGYQDFVTDNFYTSSASIRLGDGTGNFSSVADASTGPNAFAVAVGDFNTDGKQDIAVTTLGGNYVAIRLGNGSGGFSGSTNVNVGTSPYAVSVGDVNGDGALDIITANLNSNNASVRLGNGSGGFSGTNNITVGALPYAVAIGDFNLDGKEDFAVANAGESSVSILLGAANEINVQGNSTDIVDGDISPSLTDHTEFGTICLSSNVVRTYTIQNTGADINLVIPASGITLTGANANQFAVSGITLPATITPGGSTTFMVTFTPTSGGVKNAVINIANDDCDENPYNFSIRGTGNSVTGGTIGSNQTVCFDGDPAPFTSIADGTGDGTITYQWESSTTDCNSGFSPMPGYEASEADVPALMTQTGRLFRRITRSTLNGVTCEALSNCITVTVNNVNGGTIAGNQSGCIPVDPVGFTTLTGGTGSGMITYHWESSVINCNSGFTTIGGATNDTYDPPAGLTLTTYFRRGTTSTLDAVECIEYSNCVTVTVNPLPEVDPGSFDPVCANAPPVLLDGTPLGGNWDGFNITGNPMDGFYFDPSGGTQTLTYTYTDGNGCSNSGQTTIIVNNPPVVTCPAPLDLCLNGGLFNLNTTGASPSGGTFSGDGVNMANQFDPAVAGLGAHTITYTYTDMSTGCTNTCTFIITVHEPPVLTCPADFSVCFNTSPISLQGYATPLGGIYSGSGVFANIFFPASGVGDHTVTYFQYGAYDCANTCSFVITVLPLPVVTCPADFSLCSGDPDFDLLTLTYSPTGGTFSGAGVTGNTFSTSSAGVGMHIITYSYTDGNGCSNSCAFIITVNPLEVIDPGMYGPACSYDPDITLAGTPTGGVWSGTGVSGNPMDGYVFDPSVGSQLLIYTVADVVCPNSGAQFIVVNDPPVVVCPSPITVNINDPSFVLNVSTPPGGNYSGTGVNMNEFFPNVAGVGTHTITYAYTLSGCTGSCTFDIVVEPPAAPPCPDDFDVCIDDTPTDLTTLVTNGGSFSGDGVSMNTFYPAAAGPGNHTILHTYLIGMVEYTCDFVITVHALPVVTCPADLSVCINTTPFALFGASPAGGIYSGDGVNMSGVFDPSIAALGNHTITYTYTNGFGCTSSCAFTITVNTADMCNSTMEWVFLPPGSNHGSCINATNCCDNILCYGLQYTPANTGTLLNYTTGFFVNCLDGNPIISNSSCVMHDNSFEIDGCISDGLVLFNSSGYDGTLPVMSNVPVILHQVCFQFPGWDTLYIDADAVTLLTTSIQTDPVTFIDEFPDYDTYEIIRAPVAVPANVSVVVHCPDEIVTPLPPAAVDQCGSPVIPVLSSVMDSPDPLVCEGARVYTYTYHDCGGPDVLWKYTYTLERNDFTVPADDGGTVSCPAQAVAGNVMLPNVYSDCGELLAPSIPVQDSLGTDTYNGCEGTISYTWVYKDCAGNKHGWTYTFLIDYSGGLTPPASVTATVSCPIQASNPGAPPSITDACGRTVTAVFVNEVQTPNPVVCNGTIVYRYRYTACDGTTTADWTKTYTVLYSGGLTPPVSITMLISCPIDAVDPGSPPPITDACGRTVNAVFVAEEQTPNPVTCNGVIVWRYRYTACDGVTHADWTKTYLIQYSGGLSAPPSTVMTVSCPVQAVDPGAPPAILDACGRTVDAEFVAEQQTPNPVTCNGTIIWRYRYQACDRLTTVDWTMTYIVLYSGGLTPPTSLTATVSCPTEAMNPGFPPSIMDACNRTVNPTFVAEEQTPDPVSCNGTIVWRYRYTACDGLTTADWTKTYTVLYSGGLTPPTSATITVSCPAQAMDPGFPPSITDDCNRTVNPAFVDEEQTPDPVTCNGTIIWRYRYTACNGTTADWTKTYNVLYDGGLTAPTSLTMTVSCPAQAMDPGFPPSIMDGCNRTVNPTYVAEEQTPDPVTCNGSIIWRYRYTACDGTTADWTKTYTVLYSGGLTPPTSATMTVSCPAQAIDPGFPPSILDGCNRNVNPAFVAEEQTPDPVTCSGTIVWRYRYTACDGTTADWTKTYTVLYSGGLAPPTSLVMTVSCPSQAEDPGFPPSIMDACNRTVNPTFVSEEQSPDPVSCNGTIVWRYRYMACDGTTADWTKTYTVLYNGSLNPPTSATMTVSCPTQAIDPGFPPSITDACNRTVNPTFVAEEQTPNPVTCNGTIVWRYRYTGCDNVTTADWTKTYSVIYSGGLTPPMNGASTVSCPVLAVNPGPPAPITDACGRTVNAVLVGSSTPPVCEGTVVWTYRYTACDVTTTADWSYTYTIDYSGGLMPPGNGSSTVACPAFAVNPGPPANILDACGRTVVPVLVGSVSTPPAFTCEGSVVWTYQYTACDGTTADWTYTYTVEREDFTIAANSGTEVTCASEIVWQEIILPTVTSNCMEVLSPVGPVVNQFVTDTYDGCEGTISYTWTYTDCEGNFHYWTFTYDVQHTTPAEQDGPVPISTTIDCYLDAAPPADLPMIVDACNTILMPSGPVIGGTNTGNCGGTITYTYTYTDCAGIPFVWKYTNNIVCDPLVIHVWLEGAYNTTDNNMNTTLNSLHTLPGQNAPPFYIDYPAGQPYSGAPWNYSGSPGNLGTQWGDFMGQTPYPADVVDWVLVMIRKNGILPAQTIWTCAGWVHQDGQVTFPESCSLPAFSTSDLYYFVVQHRNHLGIMSPVKALTPCGTAQLEWDFRTSNSYQPVFRFGQKQVETGVWAMFAANGEQALTIAAITSTDRTTWKILQGVFGYSAGDFDLDADTDSADETIWKLNQNRTSGVVFY